MFARANGRSRWSRGPWVAAAAGLLALAVFELFLRVRGFEFHLYPTTVQMDVHGVPTDDMLGTDLSGQNVVFANIYRADPLLGWSAVPGYEAPGFGRMINALGLRGPELAATKGPGVLRLLCLGDSCTFIGLRTYPELLQAELGPGFEVVNAGVSGYSSYQGLVQLRERLLALEPDWITVYFGWNDHWLARSVPDVEVLAHQPAWRRVLEPLRLVQWLSQRWEERGHAGSLRVPLHEYRANLTGLSRLARDAGARVVLLTAPWSVGPLGHAFLVENGNTTLALSELRELHDSYNEVVREVAAAEGARLVDLEHLFSAHGKEQLFWMDGIHPNEAGYRVIARALAAEIRPAASR